MDDVMAVQKDSNILKIDQSSQGIDSVWIENFHPTSTSS